MSNYEVYVAKSYKGVVLYVGEGKIGRHKHLNSGTSHVYEANRWHHTNKNFNVEVVASVETKEDSESLERKLIDELKPCWNKIRPYSADWSEKHRFIKNRLKDGIKNKKVKAIRHDKYDNYMKIIRRFLMLSDTDGSFTLYRGQVLDGVVMPSGFYSRICDMNGSYYPHLRYLFDAHRDKKNNCYRFKIKGWKEHSDKLKPN